MNRKRCAAFLLLLPLIGQLGVARADDAPITLLGPSPQPAELFELGGPAMWLIFAVAVLGLVLTIERMINLRRGRHTPKNFHKDVVKVADMRGIDAALALCLEKSSSLSRVLYAALLRQGSVRQEMEYAVIDEGRRVLYDLRRNIRPIGVLSILAVLFGLLGACVNFIGALDDAAGSPGEHFERLAAGGVRAGIPIAFGLIVGIVLGVLYCHVRALASNVLRDVEEMGIEAVVTLDRKARQSIRLIEDIEEQIETQDMPGIKAPDLEKEFEEGKDASSSGLKTSITTHSGLAMATPAPAGPSSTGSSPAAAAGSAPSSTSARSAQASPLVPPPSASQTAPKV